MKNSPKFQKKHRVTFQTVLSLLKLHKVPLFTSHVHSVEISSQNKLAPKPPRSSDDLGAKGASEAMREQKQLRVRSYT